jgi:hypothetical protein
MNEAEIKERIKKIELDLQKLKLDLTTRENAKERKELENKEPRVGDRVQILNPRKGQEEVGTITRIGATTKYVTIDTKRGKVVRQIANIKVISRENRG